MGSILRNSFFSFFHHDQDGRGGRVRRLVIWYVDAKKCVLWWLISQKYIYLHTILKYLSIVWAASHKYYVAKLGQNHVFIPLLGLTPPDHHQIQNSTFPWHSYRVWRQPRIPLKLGAFDWPWRVEHFPAIPHASFRSWRRAGAPRTCNVSRKQQNA